MKEIRKRAQRHHKKRRRGIDRKIERKKGSKALVRREKERKAEKQIYL
jgi:hypothetical protein